MESDSLMEKLASDSEISVDSLEDLRTDDSRINPHKKHIKCLSNGKSGNSDRLTRNKEKSLGRKTKDDEMKTSEDKLVAVSRSQVNSNLNDDDRLDVSSKGSDICNYSGSYFISHAPRSQSARVPNIQRVSRRQSVCFETPESRRVRHRSVSYLEQFQRRHGRTNDSGLATLTTTPSEVTSQYCVSGTTITSSLNNTDTSTSEFEFYEELVVKEDRTVLNGMREENKQKYKVIPAEKKEVCKQGKGQSNVQELKANRDFRNCFQDHFDKRKSLEKREEYSKKVQLRNQIKAKRQKEIDKATKYEKSPFKSHPCEQEFFLCQSRELPLIPDSNDFAVVPFLINELDLTGTTRLDSCARKTLTKPVKTKTKNQKSSTEVCKLSLLQKRHESEKTIVDSIRSRFTNR